MRSSKIVKQVGRQIIESLETRRMLAIEPIDIAIDPTAGDSVHAQITDIAQRRGGGSVVAGHVGDDVYLRRFGSNGAAQGNSVQVNTDDYGAGTIRVAVNASGQSVVAWQALSGSSSHREESIQLRTYNSDGTPASAEVVLETPQFEASLADLTVGLDDAGRVAVAYTKYSGGRSAQVVIRRFNLNGSEITSNGLSVDTYVSSAYGNTYSPTPDLAVAPTGEIAVAYNRLIDVNGTLNGEIHLARWDADGGNALDVTLSNTAQATKAPVLTLFGSDRWGVAWLTLADTSTSDLYFRATDLAGTALNSQVKVNDVTDVLNPSALVSDANGNVTIGWGSTPYSSTGSTTGHLLYRSFDRLFNATSAPFDAGARPFDSNLTDLTTTFGGGTFVDVRQNTITGAVTTLGFANALIITGTESADEYNLADADGGATVRVTRTGQAPQNYVRSAYAYVHGDLGGGNDRFTALTLSLPVSVVGGEGNDQIVGSALGDSIFGEAGNDNLIGLASKDYLVGGDGNDYLEGDAGNDNMVGGANKNRFDGGAGDDRMVGSGAPDFFIGADGSDRIYGNGGDDILYGGGGTDRLYGGDGNDSLSGGGSNDRLYGEAGDDSLNGGSGKDYLFGYTGTDRRFKAEASDILDSIEML